MQITNNTTTIELNEAKLMALIIDPNISNLEKIFAKYYNCKFLEIPNYAFNAHLYLCRVVLDVTPFALAEIYDLTETTIKIITKGCDTKMKVNTAYQQYLYRFYSEYELIKEVA